MSQTNIRQNHYETVYGRNFSYAIGGSTMDYAYAKVGVPLCYTLGNRSAWLRLNAAATPRLCSTQLGLNKHYAALKNNFEIP